MLVHYEAEYWDSDTSEVKSEEGIVAPEDNTIGGAVNRVVSFYGETNVISVKVSFLEDLLTESDLKTEFNI